MSLPLKGSEGCPSETPLDASSVEWLLTSLCGLLKETNMFLYLWNFHYEIISLRKIAQKNPKTIQAKFLTTHSLTFRNEWSANQGNHWHQSPRQTKAKHTLTTGYKFRWNSSQIPNQKLGEAVLSPNALRCYISYQDPHAIRKRIIRLARVRHRNQIPS